MTQAEKKLPDGLEEAANKFAVFYDQGTCYDIAQDCFIAGAEWQKERDDLETADLLAIAHLHGMEQQKSKMLDDAVEGEVVKDINNKLAVTAKNVNLDKFKFGDKVRIIIVKEYEK